MYLFMNKKFSTLMASVLLASAFSTASAATTVQSGDLKEGDFVRLQVSGQNLVIKTNNGSASTLAIASAPTQDITTEANAKDYINAVNAQLWKVAKVTKTATGTKTFQFVNKLTGEYLAVDLATNDDNYTTKGAAELSATGNREWAFDGTELYAYSASKDSTFKFTTSGTDLKLISEKSTKTATTFTLDATNEALSLNKHAFNALMGLPTNNGKLNFNGKDVSEGQSNALKNVAWKAEKSDVTTGNLYLWNQKTTNDGTSIDANGKWVKDVKKHQYLLVDSAFHDSADQYYKLAVDTVDYELTDDRTYNKPITKRPNATAQFNADFYFLNDSIALTATAVPKKDNFYEVPRYFAQADGHDWNTVITKEGIDDLISAAKTSLQADIDKVDAIAAALEALQEGLGDWAPTETGLYKDAEGNKLTAFNTAIANEPFSEGAFEAYADEVATVKFTKAGYYVGTSVKTASDFGAVTGVEVQAVKNLNAAIQYYIQHVPGDGKKFTDAVFKSGSWSGEPTISEYGTVGGGRDGGWTGSEIMNSVGANSTSFSYWADLSTLVYNAAKYSATIGESNVVKGSMSELVAALESGDAYTALDDVKVVDEDNYAALLALAQAFTAFDAHTMLADSDEDHQLFKNAQFTVDEDNLVSWGGLTTGATLISNVLGEDDYQNSDVVALQTKLNTLYYSAADPDAEAKWFYNYSEHGDDVSTVGINAPVVLRDLAGTVVLTVATDGIAGSKHNGYTLPLIQPYATTGGDATDIVGGAKVYNLQVQDETSLRATANLNKYVISVPNGVTGKTGYTSDVDASNVYAQWVFIPGTSGYYSIVNRATRQVLYTGPVSKVKDAADKVVADTYVMGTDTLKVTGVTLNEDNFYTEKVGNKNVKYDYSGTYYAGTGEGTAVYKSFAINPVSPFLSQLAAQFDKDSVLVLGVAEDAPVWYMEKGTSKTYGVEIDGLPQLKKQLYRIYTTNADDKKIYVYETTTGKDDVYAVSLVGSEKVPAAANAAEFEFRNIAEGQYQFINDAHKMTINATPSQPILEVSAIATQKNDLFMINKSEVEKYRKLTAEDGVLGNAKIYMENEPNRYLYENTANIVANNGKGLNFLGIYNTAELTKNAALYVDTAFVERKDVYMPQYMFALGVEEVEAQDAVACTYEHNHYDNAGNKVDAAHCSHATPATMGYKSGRYLVALNDSTPENGSKKSPVYYDNAVRLAFVNAIHRNAEDSLIIKDSKWTDNNKQIVAGEETTYASKDTIKIADNKLNAATFALLIKDQETKSFYLQTANAGDKAQFVRILNGVPVLTKEIEDAAVFNIEATTEEATANEAIEASQVTVIGGQGVVTVQGAAGKVITVANILGQTIANQVAASDNVTIAAPAGVVVVAVDGDATKVVVK